MCRSSELWIERFRRLAKQMTHMKLHARKYSKVKRKPDIGPFGFRPSDRRSGFRVGVIAGGRILVIGMGVPAAGFAGRTPARRRCADRRIAGRMPGHSGGGIRLPRRLELSARQGGWAWISRFGAGDGR